MAPTGPNQNGTGPGIAKMPPGCGTPRSGSLIWRQDGDDDGLATADLTLAAARGADGEDDVAARATPAPPMSAATATAAAIAGRPGLIRAGIMTGLPKMVHWPLVH